MNCGHINVSKSNVGEEAPSTEVKNLAVGCDKLWVQPQLCVTLDKLSNFSSSASVGWGVTRHATSGVTWDCCREKILHCL